MCKWEPSLKDSGLLWPFISSLTRPGAEAIKLEAVRPKPEKNGNVRHFEANISFKFMLKVIRSNLGKYIKIPLDKHYHTSISS